MNISERGVELIKRFEGCRLVAYRCAANKLTIGWGHTGADVREGMEIDIDEAERLLKMDLVIHENNVARLVRVPLLQNQFDALVSFEFNVGYGKFRSSTLLRKLNSGDYEGAGKEFIRWVYGGGRVLGGLVKRREAEFEMYKQC